MIPDHYKVQITLGALDPVSLKQVLDELWHKMLASHKDDDRTLTASIEGKAAGVLKRGPNAFRNGLSIDLQEHLELQERFKNLAEHARELETKLAAVTAGQPEEIEERVIRAIRERRERGRAKYGTTMEREDLSFREWIQHAQEEAMDLCIYMERIKRASEQEGKK